LSGAAVSACVQPLDVIRTRMQADATRNALSGAVGTFRKIVSEEGVRYDPSWSMHLSRLAVVIFQLNGKACKHMPLNFPRTWHILQGCVEEGVRSGLSPS